MKQIANGGITDLFVYRDKLYMAGTMTFGDSENLWGSGLVRWTGEEWVRVELPDCCEIEDTVEVDGFLFTVNLRVPNYSRRHAIWRWDETNWLRIGPGGGETPGTRLNAIAYDGERLYVGGSFEYWEHRPGNNIAEILLTEDRRYGGRRSLGDGLNYRVQDLVMYEGQLIAGGSFTHSGSLELNHIAAWDGNAWHPMGDGFDLAVNHLLVYQGLLIAAGYFARSGTKPVSGLAYWEDDEWHELGGGTRHGPTFLFENDGELYVGAAASEFAHMARYRSWPISRWNGERWRLMGHGLTGPVAQLSSLDGQLYAAGAFTRAGYRDADYVAQWHGDHWTKVGNGTLSPVNTITSHVGRLYVGGAFPEFYSGTLVSRGNRVLEVRPWGDYAGLDSGTDGEVLVLHSATDGLYAGGVFSSAGGNPAPGIARWDGAWQPLGDGVAGTVHALAGGDGTLFVGGEFEMAGGLPARNVAAWQDESWQPLGDGLPNRVEALAIHDGKLFAGGLFTSLRGRNLGGVARWNGRNWVPVGNGIPGFVFGLKSIGGVLIAVGWFPEFAPGAGPNVAYWDGEEWRGFETEIDGWVEDVVMHDGKLHFAGRFSRMGSVPSWYLARYEGPMPLSEPPGTTPASSPKLVVRAPWPNPSNPVTNIRYEITQPGPVSLRILDVRGRVVMRWPARELRAGSHELAWDGVDERGIPVASGVYFVTVESKSELITRRFAVLK